MTGEFHITFAVDNDIFEADVEVTATRDGRAWDFEDFRFEDISKTDSVHDFTQFLDFMPEEVVSIAEDEAERAFLKAYGTHGLGLN
jgi:hypothetical protein